MLSNYLKIALRNIIRNKTFSLINIFGLSLGLVSFMSISLYVIDEFSYDRFHNNGERIYRAIFTAYFDGQINKWGTVPNNWLQTFAYKTKLDVFIFVLAGLVALMIAWITVSFESVKAAMKNPVESLKGE